MLSFKAKKIKVFLKRLCHDMFGTGFRYELQWIRTIEVVRESDCQSCNIMGSIPASSDTVDSEGGICSNFLSYIYLRSSVCLSSCHIPVVLSYSCHICGTLSYSLCFGDQTDQGDETEGFEREGLEMER